MCTAMSGCAHTREASSQLGALPCQTTPCLQQDGTLLCKTALTAVQLGSAPEGAHLRACSQIMELLGQSLWDVCNVPARNCLSESYVACVAIEALDILQGIHEKGCAAQPCTMRWRCSGLQPSSTASPHRICSLAASKRSVRQHGIPWQALPCSSTLCCIPQHAYAEALLG